MEVRDIGGRTGGTIDKTKEWVITPARFESGTDAGRADGPAILRLMTGKTGASIDSRLWKNAFPVPVLPPG